MLPQKYVCLSVGSLRCLYYKRTLGLCKVHSSPNMAVDFDEKRFVSEQRAENAQIGYTAIWDLRPRRSRFSCQRYDRRFDGLPSTHHNSDLPPRQPLIGDFVRESNRVLMQRRMDVVLSCNTKLLFKNAREIPRHASPLGCLAETRA